MSEQEEKSEFERETEIEEWLGLEFDELKDFLDRIEQEDAPLEKIEKCIAEITEEETKELQEHLNKSLGKYFTTQETRRLFLMKCLEKEE